MKTLTGNNVYLRALEPTDFEFLYALENDESVREVSNTTTPYSKYVLQQYLENAHRDIYEIKQLRMVICDATTERPVGFIDLFNFEPKHRRVGVGVIIFSEDDRGKGFAGEALALIRNYAVIHLTGVTDGDASEVNALEKSSITNMIGDTFGAGDYQSYQKVALDSAEIERRNKDK